MIAMVEVSGVEAGGLGEQPTSVSSSSTSALGTAAVPYGDSSKLCVGVRDLLAHYGFCV